MLCRIGFCNLILSAQAMAEGTADYEKWMTETRKRFVGNYAGCKTIEHNIACMTEDKRCVQPFSYFAVAWLGVASALVRSKSICCPCV
eukprot:COSAG02_NODE_10568_length_1911_cov_2.064570_2_plen_88_part_00